MKRYDHDVYMMQPHSRAEFLTLVSLLDGRARGDAYTKLAALFWEDFAAFLAVFQGQVLRIPSKAYVERSLLYCRIWLYVQERGGPTDEVLQLAGHEFSIPLRGVRSIVDRVVFYLGRVKGGVDGGEQGPSTPTAT